MSEPKMGNPQVFPSEHDPLPDLARDPTDQLRPVPKGAKAAPIPSGPDAEDVAPPPVFESVDRMVETYAADPRPEEDLAVGEATALPPGRTRQEIAWHTARLQGLRLLRDRGAVARVALDVLTGDSDQSTRMAATRAVKRRLA